jgi:hypothetical protein
LCDFVLVSLGIAIRKQASRNQPRADEHTEMIDLTKVAATATPVDRLVRRF